MTLHQINQHIRIGWYAVILIVILAVTCSCDIQKEAVKNKNDIETSETIKTETYRKGDTVTYIVPKITYKDTIIETVSRQGTILRNYYNKDGQIYKNDCLSAEYRELREEIRNMRDESKSKESSKTEEFDSGFILYIVIGVVIIFLFGLFLLFLIIKSKFG